MTEAIQSATIDYREGDNYYRLLIKTSLLTFVTLGLYRFWQTAAMRRYYWSSIAIDGDSLEYSGTGVETFIGFLFALVVTAIYLGIFVVAGSFAGLLLFENFTAIQFVAIGAFVPIFYFARYRFRRYLLSRTSWRGIRFGLMKGAWGFVWRGTLFLILTLATLGAFEPVRRYRLEKYVTDRIRVGDQHMSLRGGAGALYRFYAFFYLTLVIATVAISIALWRDAFDRLFLLGVIFAPLLYVGYFFYIIRSQRYFMEHRHLGEALKFHGAFRFRSVFGRYFFGYLFATMISSFVLIAAIIGIVVIAASIAFFDQFGASAIGLLEQLENFDPEDMSHFSIWILVPFAFLYLATVLSFDITKQVFVVQPIAKYVAKTTSIQSKDGLGVIGQGKLDDIQDADGFADALDIGFGF